MGAAENQDEPIVDALIAERAPKLRALWAWPLIASGALKAYIERTLPENPDRRFA